MNFAYQPFGTPFWMQKTSERLPNEKKSICTAQSARFCRAHAHAVKVLDMRQAFCTRGMFHDELMRKFGVTKFEARTIVHDVWPWRRRQCIRSS